MDKHTLVIEVSKFFEKSLDKIGANGKGLNEKAVSLENSLPHEFVKKLKIIARERNRLVHSDDDHLDEVQYLKDALDIAFEWNHQHIKKTYNEPKLEHEYLSPKVDALTLELKASQVVDELLIEVKIEKLKLSDKNIKELLLKRKPKITKLKLEQLIDSANTIAMAEYYNAYEPWHAFQFLAKKSTNDVERLNNLALSLCAGEDIAIILGLTKELISHQFLNSEYEAAFCNKD